MALTSKITRTIEIPDEPGVRVTIRQLSHYQLMMAIDNRQDHVIDKAKRLGEAMRYIPEGGDSSLAEESRNKYDHTAVLRAGVVGWSYDYELTDENLLEQDDAWSLCVFDAIIALSVRPAEERKNSDGVSPLTSEAPAAGQES